VILEERCEEMMRGNVGIELEREHEESVPPTEFASLET